MASEPKTTLLLNDSNTQGTKKIRVLNYVYTVAGKGDSIP